MEQSPSWEAKISKLLKKSPHFMEPEGSSPYTQEPAFPQVSPLKPCMHLSSPPCDKKLR